MKVSSWYLDESENIQFIIISMLDTMFYKDLKLLYSKIILFVKI